MSELSVATSFENYPCKIQITSPAIAKEDESWAFQKGSPYYEVFNHQIKKMLEAGMMAKAIKQLFEAKRSTMCPDDETFEAISYENIISAFAILPLGIFLALFIFIIEKMKNCTSEEK